MTPAAPEDLAELSARIDAWAERELRSNPLVRGIEAVPAERRWLVRLAGEEKEFITVWLTLRERTLHVETYFMPHPEENAEQLWEYLLRLNNRLFTLRFALGSEDAVYLMGQVPVTAVDEDELDRLVGAAYAYSEQYFRPAIRTGFASRFGGG